MNPPQKTHKNERGVVIIWTAFFMLMMLGFVALGIDVAKLMATRTELQNAADAAALAGASALDRTTGQLMPDSAVMRAQYTSSGNKAFVNAPVSVTLLAGDVQVNSVDNTVKVTVRRDAAGDGSMVTHVAQVLGITTMDVSATATAKADRVCEQCERLTPMAALPPPGETGFQVGCGRVYTLAEGQGGGANGNWQLLSFPDCDEGQCSSMSGLTGADYLRCLLEHGYACCVGINDIVQTKPGANVGAVRPALQARWDADPDKTPDICYRDYTGDGHRVVHVPVTRSLGGGRTDVIVVGFSAFFMKRRPVGNDPVYAEFIYDVVPGEGGNCNSTVFTIRLIE